MRNDPKGIEIPLKSLYGHLPEIPFILYSRRPSGRLLVNQEKIGIIEQKILSCSPAVKEKNAGWIVLENSSYDEYSEPLKNFGGSTLSSAP